MYDVQYKKINGKSKKKSSAVATSPGLSENQKKRWRHWDEKFFNYTRSHIGANGVPLSYVIRENEEPDFNGEYPDFINKTVAYSPLEG